MDRKQEAGAGLFLGVAASIVIIAIIVLMLLWTPIFGPWIKERAGYALLKEAEQSRQIRIEEAKSKEAAAEFLAQAEITKAKGVAEANGIMSESLGGPEGYLRWKYIEMLEETGLDNNTIIYIPTEAGMPILEAGRIANKSLEATE